MFVGCWPLSMNLWGCQGFCVYEMIILFHPYGTLVAYIMQHGGKAHNLSGGDGTYIMIAHARALHIPYHMA